MTVHLERRDPARKMARFYAIRVVPTLFGRWAVVREWGRIGSPGTVRSDWYDDVGAAEEAIERLARAKMRRGYVPRSLPPSEEFYSDRTKAGLDRARANGTKLGRPALPQATQTKITKLKRDDPTRSVRST